MDHSSCVALHEAAQGGENDGGHVALRVRQRPAGLALGACRAKPVENIAAAAVVSDEVDVPLVLKSVAEEKGVPLRWRRLLLVADGLVVEQEPGVHFVAESLLAVGAVEVTLD